MAWKLVGKRVAFTKCQEEKGKFSIGGSMQQYVVTSALQCIQIPDEVSFEHGAMHFVNPMTALGLVESAHVQWKSPAIIQTGAASQLGRMVVKICKQEGIPLINIVRRQEQVELLQELGAEHIINSSVEGWEQTLGELAMRLKARACLECVAGEMTGKVLNKMPSNSVIYVYGALSQQDCSCISPLALIGKNQTIKAWLLNEFIASKGLFSVLGFLKKTQRLMSDGTLASQVAARIGLEEVVAGIQKYEANMTAGKYIIYPNKE